MILNQTLWVAVFLSLILGAYGKLVAGHVRTAGQTEEFLQARLLAESGTEIGLAIISSRRAARGVPEPLRLTLPRGAVFINFEDTSGKIDLNTAPLGLIKIAAPLAGLTADALKPWAETLDAYRSAGTVFTSLEEAMALAQLDEASTAFFQQIYTIHSELEFIDPEKAHPRLAGLLARQSNEDWQTRVSSQAYKVTSRGVGPGGTDFIYSATYKAQPLTSKERFRLVARTPDPR